MTGFTILNSVQQCEGIPGFFQSVGRLCSVVLFRDSWIFHVQAFKTHLLVPKRLNYLEKDVLYLD